MSGMPLPRKDVSPSEMALNTSEAMPTPSREEEHVGDTENMIVLPTPSEVSNASTRKYCFRNICLNDARVSSFSFSRL